MVSFNKDGRIDMNEARALEGVAMLMQQLQADLHLGANHVDMVLAGLRKKNISYMLVISDALRERIKPIEAEKLNAVVQRGLAGSRRSDFGLK